MGSIAENRFERIKVEGFRRLASVELELRPLSVLIGANGSGKTSLLDVFSLLAGSASGSLKSKLSEMHGIGANLTAGFDTAGRADGGGSGYGGGSGGRANGGGRGDGYASVQELYFELSMHIANQAPLIYSLRIAPTNVAYEISEELLTQQRIPQPPPHYYIQSHHGDVKYFEVDDKKLVRPTWDHNPMETSLAQVPKMYREPEDFRKRLASSTHYHVLDVASRAPVRQPQPLRPADLPGRDGEDLVSCLFHMREADRDRYEAVEDALRTGFPGFDRLDFPPVAAGTLAMTWRDKHFPKPLFMHQLSEGTLRFLWLVTLLQSPGLTAVTLIDEPEVSLHPELLSLLADLMREASARTQLIIATHADRLVRFLEPKEVIVMDLDDDGMAKATWADQMDLEGWLSEYTLDEVWRMGRMGGRP